MFPRPCHPARRRTRLAALAAFSLAAAVVASGLPTSPPPAAAAPSSSKKSPLAFDVAPPGAGSKLVFAHYWPPLPVSIDNENPKSDYYARNHTKPHGENGKHRAYGGYMRDRPIPRAPKGASWRLQDLKKEVRQAIGGGLDGFALDLMQLPGDSDYRQVITARTMMKAAHQVDPRFRIMLMPDMGGSVAGKSPSALAKYVAELGRSKSAHRLSDGRLVVSPFKAEAHSASWWANFMSIMKNTHKMPVAFVPVFVGNEQNYAKSFSSISYGMSNWGSRNPKWNDPNATYPTSPVGRAKKIRANGDMWMQPVSVQDSRPRSGVFDEAQNSQNLRNTWKIARKSGARWVQIPTWNDYTENANIAPSQRQGYSWLDINAYYATWFKTGQRPKIVRDTVYVTHRTQPWQAKPRYPQQTTMKLRGGSPARNTVEALTFLTKPGTVQVTVGGQTTSCKASAGVDTCTVPLRAGSVSAKVVRAGTTVAKVRSKNKVTNSPYVQDLKYLGASSGRQGTSGPTQSSGNGTTKATSSSQSAPKSTTHSTGATPKAKDERAVKRVMRQKATTERTEAAGASALTGTLA